MAHAPKTDLLRDGEPQTVVQAIGRIWDTIHGELNAEADPQVSRAFAIAKTALEDARVRYTEARARQLGVYNPADLDRVVDDPKAYFDERDRKAGEAGQS